MPDELTEPGYRPEYTGDDGLGDVGSGRELGASLYALYRADRNELPDVASVYAQMVGKIHPVRSSMEVQLDRPRLGMEQVHRRLLELREQAHMILRQNCLRMLEVGQALVETADAYAATDQAAAEEFINARLTELASEADQWAATEIESLKEEIKPYTWPQGSMYESDCIEPIKEAHQLLETEVSTDFGGLKHTLGDWTGDAADNFATSFYYAFEQTLRSQKRMLTALVGGIASAKAIAESTQHSIMNVVLATKAALEEQLKRAQATAELERQQSRQQALIITGGLVAGGATVFAGVLSAAAATSTVALWSGRFAAVSGASQIATAAIPDDASVSFDIGGATAEQLLGSLSEAIIHIKERDGYQHRELLQEVDAVVQQVEALEGGDDGEDGRLIPIRPDIVDGVDADTFYLP